MIVIEHILDWVVIVTGIIWAIVYFALLLATLAVGYFATKYLNKAHTLKLERLNPVIAKVQEKAEQVRLKTASLPGLPRPEGAEPPAIAAGASLASLIPNLSNLPIPFLRRRKPWYKRLFGL